MALEPATLRNLGLEVGASLRSAGLPPIAADPQWKVDPASLEGFVLRWPRETKPAVVGRMLAPIRRAMNLYVRVELADIYQPMGSIVLAELQAGGKAYPVVIDLHDFPLFQDPELVKRSLAYFKMQYQSGGYDIPQVVPGGYLTDKGTIYWYLRHLRQLRDRREFTCDVYGRFGLRFGAELRRKTVGILTEQQRISFHGGLQRVPRATFLKEIAQSRVCIDLPGQADAFCPRLISYMAIGACIVGPRPKNELHAPLIDRVHVAWTRDDQSDLVDLCQYYVENDDAREQMVAQTRLFFDRYLHAESLAAYYLYTCISRLSEA